MADRPILFSGPMVRALFAGTKTQTRRVISTAERKTRPNLFDGSWSDSYVLDPGNVSWREQEYSWRVGDRLYVREAWRAQDAFDHLSPVEIGNQFAEEYGEPCCPVFYEADQRCDGSSAEMWKQSPTGKFRQAMHMPRWASRLTLIVTDVRVQRLQEISEADAEAEGAAPILVPPDGGSAPHVEGYRALWDSLNADRAPWSSNPWVVAVSFTVHRGNIDHLPALTEER